MHDGVLAAPGEARQAAALQPAHARPQASEAQLTQPPIANEDQIIKPFARRAELPRDVRDALVTWNHATDYELPAYSTYAGGKGSGLFEKTYDLGAAARRGHRLHVAEAMQSSMLLCSCA